jgi:hypothetical protein
VYRHLHANAALLLGFKGGDVEPHVWSLGRG